MRNRDLARLKHVRTLDPVTDYEEIYRTVAQYEFGWETKLGMYLAFYRTFGIPAIAELLYSTGEMTERTRKRADDTGLLMYELITNGLESERGRAAVKRRSQARVARQRGAAAATRASASTRGAPRSAPASCPRGNRA